jgi:CRP-like cAMP-binding protein
MPNPAQPSAAPYRVWGADKIAYGPLTHQALGEWALALRVRPDDWIYSDADHSWKKAAERPEVQEHFRSSPPARSSKQIARLEGLKGALGLLRSLDLFTGLTDEQIESFSHYAEIMRVKQYVRIVQAGDPGDAMFIVLDGEVRAYVIAMDRECTLSTIGPGEFIGEVSLLDQGARSASLAANRDTTLLRITVGQLESLSREAPALAAPFFIALSRTVVKRIRNTTERYAKTVDLLGRRTGLAG